MEKYLTLLKDLLVEYSPKVLYALGLLIVGLFAIKLIIRLTKKLLNVRHVDETLQTFLGNLIGWGLKALLLVAVISKLGVDTTRKYIARKGDLNTEQEIENNQGRTISGPNDISSGSRRKCTRISRRCKGLGSH